MTKKPVVKTVKGWIAHNKFTKQPESNGNSKHWDEMSFYRLKEDAEYYNVQGRESRIAVRATITYELPK